MKRDTDEKSARSVARHGDVSGRLLNAFPHRKNYNMPGKHATGKLHKACGL